ncbi:hypothetical protein CF319_g6789 [Tilletia indica]|nr:hypothetical protein CF319_g6789 [Tilletia indica]
MPTPDPSPDKVQSAGLDAAKTSRSRHSDAGDRVAGDSSISSEEQEHLSLVKRDDASTSPMGPSSSQLPDFFTHGGGSSEHNMSGPQLLSTTHTMSNSDTFLQYVDEILGKIYDEDADLYWNELDKALKSIHFLTALCALGARESQGP